MPKININKKQATRGKKEIEELAAIFDRALLQRKKKKYDIELDELELKLIIASLKRSISAVKKGSINPAGREYLDKLYKDLTGILGHA